jgi:hypothetical protein
MLHIKRPWGGDVGNSFTNSCVKCFTCTYASRKRDCNKFWPWLIDFMGTIYFCACKIQTISINELGAPILWELLFLRMKNKSNYIHLCPPTLWEILYSRMQKITPDFILRQINVKNIKMILWTRITLNWHFFKSQHKFLFNSIYFGFEALIYLYMLNAI